jgi:NNP family nitrate/nitrite transporter-like MFS transporter
MPDKQTAVNTFSTSMPAIVLLTLLFFFNFSSRLITGPCLPAIENDLMLSHSWAGFLLLVASIGSSISQASAGILAAILDYKKTILLSALGLSAALIWCGSSQDFWSLAMGLFFIGLMGGLYISAGISLINHITPRVHWGKAMAIHELAPNLGLVLTPLLVAWCLANASWRLGFYVMAAAVLTMGVIFLFFGRGKGLSDELPRWKLIKRTLQSPAILTIAALLTLGVAVEVGVFSVLTLFLVNERSYDPATANQLVGLAKLPGIFLVLLSGWLCDRLGIKWALMSIMAVTGAVVMALGICPAYLTTALVVAQAAASACIFPPILAAASALSDPATRVWTLGISLSACAILGGGLLPWAITWAGEMGSFGLGISGVGLLTFFSAFLVPLLRLD